MKVNKRRRRRLSKRTGAIIVLCVTLVLTLCAGYLGVNGTWLDSRGLYRLLPWIPTMNTEQWPQSIPLGLDLKGGMYVEYEAAMSEGMAAEGQGFDALLDSTMTIMASRLTGGGYPEATVSRLGSTGIRVEIPDGADMEALLELIGSPARIAFLDPEGNAFMDHSYVEEVGAYINTDYSPVLSFKLTSEGARIFGDMTRDSIGQQLSITLDGETLSSPTVSSELYEGSMVVTCDFAVSRVPTIALQLKNGPMPLDLHQENQGTLSATLGADALQTCTTAMLIGILLVMAFMLFRYRVLGLVADWALCIYGILLFLFIAAISGIQLTLPSIAGIVLSIGMAMSANITIIERVREEAQAGRPMVYALRIGFKGAMSAVLDVSIVTVIAAVALLLVGTGSVQSFATVLLLGAIISVINAVVVTRFLLARFVSIVRKPSWFVEGTTPKENAETTTREAK